MRTLSIDLSDVDRGVYEAFELRVAQHPSESLAFLWSRILGYCLSYGEGIRLSKAGLSNAEESPVAIWSADGSLDTWIDVGAPAAERLHKASKAARQVVLYSSVDIDRLRKDAAKRRVHRIEDIEVWCLPAALLDGLAELTGRSMDLALVRTEGQLYATLDGNVIEARVVRDSLVSP